MPRAAAGATFPFDPEEDIGRTFMFSNSAYPPWPCMAMKTALAEATDLTLPAAVREAFDKSKIRSKVLLLFFPVPPAHSNIKTQWVIAPASGLVDYDSLEARGMREASVRRLFNQKPARHGKRNGLVSFVAAMDEAKQFWSCEEDEEDSWVECSACKKWRRLVPGLDAEFSEGAFQCAKNTWRPSQASCGVPQEEEESDHTEGGNDDADTVPDSAEQSGGWGGGGGERGGGSGGSSSSGGAGGAEALSDTEPEEEFG